MTTSQVRELALGLPLQERARLWGELIDSLEPDTPDPGVEEAWIEEIDARAEVAAR